MLVIIEGCDKSGKTTLAKKLSDKLKWPICHFSAPGDDPAEEYAKFAKQQGDFICDRFFVGELVYGPLLRNKNSMSSLEIKTIERICRLNGNLLIHMDLDYSVIEKRFKALGDDNVSIGENWEAYQRFKEIISCRNLSLLKIQNEKQIDVNFIIEKAMQIKIKADSIKPYVTGIGTIIGRKIVFVGDKLNPKSTRFNVPFDGGPASEYLCTAMSLAGVSENFVYLTNADTLGYIEIRTLKSLGATQFIALGTEANKQLERLGIKHKKIDHPQYWNRFHHNKVDNYAKMLKSAVDSAYVYY